MQVTCSSPATSSAVTRASFNSLRIPLRNLISFWMSVTLSTIWSKVSNFSPSLSLIRCLNRLSSGIESHSFTGIDCSISAASLAICARAKAVMKLSSSLLFDFVLGQFPLNTHPHIVGYKHRLLFDLPDVVEMLERFDFTSLHLADLGLESSKRVVFDPLIKE